MNQLQLNLKVDHKSRLAQIKRNLVDTHAITEIYMQRPVEKIAMGLGEWFNAALNLNNKELQFAGTREAKQLILDLGYNTIPGMQQTLKEFNRAST